MGGARDRTRRAGRSAVGIAVCGMSLLAGERARASGVDGAGRIMIVPWVVTGEARESQITLTNAGHEDLLVDGIYVGMEGTPKAGVRACPQRLVPREGSLTLPLRILCPGAYSDGENQGYVELTSAAPDVQGNFFATSAVETNRATSFSVAGQPVGAYDPGFSGLAPGLEVAGLRTRAAQDETLYCYVASLAEPKRGTLQVRDASGTPLNGLWSFNLPPRRMERVAIASAVGLSPADREPLSVAVASSDGALVLAGCGAERPATSVLTYHPAQASAPADRARLRSVNVNVGLQPGPYSVGYIWNHSAVGGSVNQKVVLTTYLRWDDQFRCRLVPWAGQEGGFDGSPWLDLRIVDPLGAVIAGGTGIKDTGTVSTQVRGHYPPGTTQRFQIEISFDQAYHAVVHWPLLGTWPFQHQALTGGWEIHCDSAAGMSEPIPLDRFFPDDF
jgi:hypothetical protein